MAKNIKKSIQEKKREDCANLLRAKVPRLKIQKRLKLSKRTIVRVQRRLATRKSLRRKCGSKGNKKLLRGEKLLIQNLVRKNPFLSCLDIKNELNLLVTRLYLKEAKFVRKKPYPQFTLTQDHVQARLSSARQMKDFIFSPEIIFTDTSSIWLFDNNHEG